MNSIFLMNIYKDGLVCVDLKKQNKKRYTVKLKINNPVMKENKDTSLAAGNGMNELKVGLQWCETSRYDNHLKDTTINGTTLLLLLLLLLLL